MARINDAFLKLKAGYLFPEIARRVAAFAAAEPSAQIIRLGIGDVTEPLPPVIVSAMHRALDEMASRQTFRGYGPEQGYDWLRQTIVAHDYCDCRIEPDEIFVSDGSKCDSANILDIFASGQNRIAVVDPVYPVYVDTNVMAGNTSEAQDGYFGGLTYMPATEANGFVPDLPDGPVDLIYLCYPNNPTGAVASQQTLSTWVRYAQDHEAVILFDAAYEAYISDPAIPHSIYEVPGAREVAVEFRSFSKSAGFTGTRCAYTVVPKSVQGLAADGGRVSLHQLWQRRQATKFNGVAYIVQRGAEAAYSQEGRQEIRSLVDHYLGNAQIIRRTLEATGFEVYGGTSAPYVWIKTPPGTSSWAFFDTLLRKTHVVCTPGSGFGAAGEGYARISAFNSRAAVEQAMQRIRDRLDV